LDGVAALELGPNLVFPIIDRLLGGAGRAMTATRPMTEIERKIIQGVLKLILDNLCESWRPVYSIEFAVTSTETNPHMVQITAPNEMVLRFQFQVRMRELMAKLNFAIPTILLDPIIHIFDQEEYTTRKVIRDGTLVQLLNSVPVNLTISTVETSFPMRSLITLQVGDTLVLDQRQDAPVILRVAGRSKLYAKARIDSTHKAFVVTGPIRPRREETVNGNTEQ
jgi:flagellar motor switch protein FliM